MQVFLKHCLDITINIFENLPFTGVLTSLITAPVEPEVIQYTKPAIQKAIQKNIRWIIEDGSILAAWGEDAKEGTLER